MFWSMSTPFVYFFQKVISYTLLMMCIENRGSQHIVSKKLVFSYFFVFVSSIDCLFVVKHD